MSEWVQTIITIVGALGGFEAIKWLLSRKSNTRIATAEAEMAETKAEGAEFELLTKRIEVAEQQLLTKEERFHEQTQHVRNLQQQLLEKVVEIGELQAKISALEAERAMKLCERRGCCDRIPQSGY